jgi:hypothetical protein
MKLTPEDIAYLRAQAQAKGYNADDLLKAIQYESSGRPDVWGGKGGDYFGLIQFGPNERKTYAIDTQNPTARNQIDGALRFLGDRGFKPGMGLLDLYSTINAGSPGHYKASDGNGTVASHVAKMMGQSLPAGMTLSSPAEPAALSYADSQPTTPKADPIAELLALGAGTQQKPAGNMTELVTSLLAEPEKPQQPANSTDDAFIRQMMDFHNARHMSALQGLL